MAVASHWKKLACSAFWKKIWARSVKSVKWKPAPTKAVHLGTVLPSVGKPHLPVTMVMQKCGVSLDSNGRAYRPTRCRCIARMYTKVSHTCLSQTVAWSSKRGLVTPLASMYTFDLTYSRCTMESTVDFVLRRYKVCLLWIQVRPTSPFAQDLSVTKNSRMDFWM